MGNRSELDRRAIIDSKSPLARHSLNQKNMRDQRAGVTRVFGKEVNRIKAQQRREESRAQRKQVLFDSINNIFEGNASETDIMNIVFLSEEFETSHPEALNATVVDLTCVKPANAYYGEPALFRKKK